jgi:diguanylate cyclase (GGDEF)-like protein
MKAKQEIEELNKQLFEQANKDFLTKLYNRRGFEEHCRELIELAKRAGNMVSIAMFDLDHFKKINDTYGHETGDQVLKHIANLLQDASRKSDLIGRYGGEEFMLIMPPRTDKEEAIVAAERVRLYIQNHSLENVGRITISAGVATVLPQQQNTNDEVFELLRQQADKALYCA